MRKFSRYARCDLIRDAILIAAAGFIIGFVTGGGSNAVAAYINSGKLAAETPRFVAILDTLRAAAAVSCAGLGKTTTNIWAVSVDVAHLARANANLAWSIEGGRTRTGKLRPPTHGILRYLTDAVDRSR